MPYDSQAVGEPPELDRELREQKRIYHITERHVEYLGAEGESPQAKASVIQFKQTFRYRKETIEAITFGQLLSQLSNSKRVFMQTSEMLGGSEVHLPSWLLPLHEALTRLINS